MVPAVTMTWERWRRLFVRMENAAKRLTPQKAGQAWKRHDAWSIRNWRK